MFFIFYVFLFKVKGLWFLFWVYESLGYRGLNVEN